MNLTLLNAIKEGWKPDPPGKPETYFCQGGCIDSAAGFLRAKEAQKKKAVTT